MQKEVNPQSIGQNIKAEVEKSRRALKAPAKKREKKEKEVVSLTLAESLIQAADSLKLVNSDWSKEGGTRQISVRLPKWSNFQKQLDKKSPADTEKAKLFFRLRDAIQSLTGDAESTWILRSTGSFVVFSRFQ